jgi:hypothetical protein
MRDIVVTVTKTSGGLVELEKKIKALELYESDDWGDGDHVYAYWNMWNDKRLPKDFDRLGDDRVFIICEGYLRGFFKVWFCRPRPTLENAKVAMRITNERRNAEKEVPFHDHIALQIVFRSWHPVVPIAMASVRGFKYRDFEYQETTEKELALTDFRINSGDS